MQPPQFFGQRFIESLRQHVKDQQAERDRQAQRINNITPPKPDYEAEIRKWWESLPPATRDHPWSIETIAAQFKGRYNERPALRLIAQGLRANGWTEKRDWSCAGRNRRVWLPRREESRSDH